jgi:hypothetical protein
MKMGMNLLSVVCRPQVHKILFICRKEASPVKVYGETTLIFPLLVAETFARHFHKKD